MCHIVLSWLIVAIVGMFGIISEIKHCESQCVTNNKVLFYGPTFRYSIYRTLVENLGYTVDVVYETEWVSMNSTQFGKYNAIVFSDSNSGAVSYLDAAVSNADEWSSVINGNIVILGTDEAGHSAYDVVENGLKFVLDDTCYQTGLYMSLSEYYGSESTAVNVPVLGYFGTFSSIGTTGCFDDAHVVAVHEVLENLSDESLSNWGCSVHETFVEYPADFVPLVIANNLLNNYTIYFADGSFGIPYILARGQSLSSVFCDHNQTLKCSQDNDCRYEYDSIEASPTDGSMLGGDLIYVKGPCFDTVSDWYCVFGSTRSLLTPINTTVGTCTTPGVHSYGYVPFGIMTNDDWYSNSLLITLFYYNHLMIESDSGISFNITSNQTIINMNNDFTDNNIAQGSSAKFDSFYGFGESDSITINWDKNSFLENSIQYVSIFLFQIIFDNSSSYTYDFHLIDIIDEYIDVNLETYDIQNLQFTDNVLTEPVYYYSVINENSNVTNAFSQIVFYVAEANEEFANYRSVGVQRRTRNLLTQSQIVTTLVRAAWAVARRTPALAVAGIAAYFLSPVFCETWAVLDSTFGGDDWLNNLPDCPDDYPFQDNCLPSGDGWSRDDACQNGDCSFHPGAENCIRHTAGQQCCYTSNDRLCTTGFCAGTPDRQSADGDNWGNVALHVAYDVLPFVLCCGVPGFMEMDSSCETYMERRPPNQGGGAAPNCAPVGGDPHFYSLDYYFYTFNGIGEYYLIYHEIGDVSVALTSVSVGDGNDFSLINQCQGSVATAFGIHDKISDKIWSITTGDGTSGITFYENGNEILFPTFDNQSVSLKFSDFEIVYDYTEVQIAFVNIGVSLQLWLIEMENTILNNSETLNYFDYSVTVSTSLYFNQSLVGLLGNFDGISTNDVQFRDGTIYYIDDTDTATDTETINQNIYEFGESWKIDYDVESSIINYYNSDIQDISSIYCDNQTFSINFTFCSYILNDTDFEASIRDLCDGSYQCLYDASVTCDVTFAEQSLTFATVAEGIIEYLQEINRDGPFDCPSQCDNSPCDCTEVENCKICHNNVGCSQCKRGFFKTDYDYQCANCTETFGTECMHCADFHGCQQCRKGYNRTKDANCGLYYCQEIV